MSARKENISKYQILKEILFTHYLARMYRSLPLMVLCVMDQAAYDIYALYVQGFPLLKVIMTDEIKHGKRITEGAERLREKSVG